MSESLRDQLLKSGLARKFKAEPAKPANVPSNGVPSKGAPHRHAPHKPAPPRRERSEIDLAKAYAIRDSSERAERDRAQRELEQRAREKKERRQRLTQLLDGKAQNAQDADIARHFPHANKIRRVYVTQAQLPRLNGGELAVVQLAGRYLIVDIGTAKAARDIDPEALVLLCDPMEGAAEDDVPSDIVW
jgi:uncharacterized protein YaiL (DUF2058 family)